MRRSVAGGLLPWLALAGCAVAGGVALPDALDEQPGDAPHDAACWGARRALEAGDGQAALAALAPVLRAAPDHVDAQRVRQDVLRSRGRLGLLRVEADHRVAAAPDDAHAHYLRGRILPTDAGKLAEFELATRLAPRSFWGWLGKAFVLRADAPQQALAIYRWLWQASGQHPLAGVALAAALRRAPDPQAALAVYGALRGHPLVPGVAELGLAQVYASQDKLDAGWPALLAALERRPFDAGALSLLLQYLARGLPADQVHQAADVLRVAPERLAATAATPAGAATAASLLADAGDPWAALAVLEAAPRPPRGPGEFRRWQRLRLQVGDVRGFLTELAEWLPASLLADETNELRGIWLELLGGPWSSADDPLADLEQATGLVRALLRAGMLAEAQSIASIAAARHGSAPPAARGGLERLRQETSRELAFERAVRRMVYRGYSASPPRSLDQLLDELRTVSREILGRDVVGEPQRFTLPLIGELLDPFADGLCAHFAAYNRHLVLGRRASGAPEAFMLVRLAKRPLARHPDLPLAGPAWEVVGEDRRMRSSTGAYGGDLAGVALLNHYVIDMDSVRDWARELQERRVMVREDGGAALRDPLPEEVATLDPVAVEWRLAALAPCADEQLEAQVLDIIRWHERAHLVDVFHFLPLENNLGRALGLLLRHGFSRSSIEAEMEARAETAALALAQDPRLVLAHLAVFLEGQSESPHALGFRRVARRLALRLEAAGQDPRASRWHTLDPEVVRAHGRELLRELW